MNNSKKRTEKKILYKVKDTLLLVLVALVLGLGFFFFIGFLSGRNISKEWILFIVGCLTYSVTIIYGSVTLTGFRKSHQKTISLMILITIILLPITALFLIFYFRVRSLPNHLLPYMVGNFLLAPVGVLFFQYCLKIIRRKENSRKKDLKRDRLDDPI